MLTKCPFVCYYIKHTEEVIAICQGLGKESQTCSGLCFYYLSAHQEDVCIILFLTLLLTITTMGCVRCHSAFYKPAGGFII